MKTLPLINDQRLSRTASIIAVITTCVLVSAVLTKAQVLGDPVDVSQDFQKMENIYFVGSKVVDFNPLSGQGTLQWNRYVRSTTSSFNKMDVTFARGKSTEFPGTEYDQDPTLPFSVTFVSPRTIRLRMNTRAVPLNDGSSSDAGWSGSERQLLEGRTD